MDKKDFRELLLNNGVQYITVVSFGDMKGGRQNYAFLRKVTHEDLEGREDCPHIEWDGDVSDAVKCRKELFFDEFQPFHEPAFENVWMLEDLVDNAIRKRG